MRVSSVRPDVGSLVFCLFGRSIHPELLTIFARTEIRQPGYSAVIQICDAGHTIAFQHNKQTLCEVTTGADRPLPQGKQVIARRLRGHRNESVEHDAGMLYHVSFQVEQLEPEVFQHFHEELLLDCTRCRVSHQFAASSRLCPAPLSFVQIEDHPHTLLIHAFHTFPDNFAVVKTQSLFEV
jgi:hypothetical protein